MIIHNKLWPGRPKFNTRARGENKIHFSPRGAITEGHPGCKPLDLGWDWKVVNPELRYGLESPSVWSVLWHWKKRRVESCLEKWFTPFQIRTTSKSLSGNPGRLGIFHYFIMQMSVSGFLPCRFLFVVWKWILGFWTALQLESGLFITQDQWEKISEELRM